MHSDTKLILPIFVALLGVMAAPARAQEEMSTRATVAASATIVSSVDSALPVQGFTRGETESVAAAGASGGSFRVLELSGEGPSTFAVPAEVVHEAPLRRTVEAEREPGGARVTSLRFTTSVLY